MNTPRIKHSNQTCSPEQEKHRREEPPQVEGTKKWGWSMAGEIGKANKISYERMDDLKYQRKPGYSPGLSFWG